MNIEHPSPYSDFFRAKSPILRQMEDKSSTYDAAMAKLYDASWKFDRGKNGEFLKTLDNKRLPKQLFRQIIRAGMNCKLTDSELDVLMPLFDNEGSVNGCEFILLFYRLRYEHRSKVLSMRVQKQKHATEMQIYKQKKKLEDLETKTHIGLTDYTDDDLDSAMQKIINAAVKYDRLMPGAVQLDAFESEYMIPNVFREQLKMVFNVQLTVPELSAFIRNFNKDKDDPTSENIICSAFLVTFFRAGFNEKTRRLRAYWAKEKSIQDEKERKRQEEEKELALKNSMKVNFSYTEEDKVNAVRKLRAAARLYDKTTPGSMSMKAFEVKFMPPHVFKEQLRRVFNLQVTPPEMGALMDVFDVDGDGVITCEEFSKVFINMGFEERTKYLKEDLARQKRIDEDRLRRTQEKEEQLAKKNALKLSYTYTEEEWDSAMEKLVEAAWAYDKTMPGAPCLDAFEKRYMEPHVFKEQMRRAFYMKLTPQELGAIMHYFDPERTGRIHCETFLKRFVKMGFEERQRRLALWREHEQNLQERREREKAMKQKAADDKYTMVGMERTYSEADFQSAFSKLTVGAIKYDRAGPGAVGLNAFQAESMPPHVFREQLKLVFNVKVSLPELWALVAYFDPKQTGVINCQQFLVQFLRTGYEERMAIQKANRRLRLAKLERDVQEEVARERKKQEKAWSEVDFDYLEEDFDRALKKIVYLCHNYDPRQVGPAGLRAFQAESMNPAEFREQLKRTFNVKFGPRELGAAVTYFDTGSKKVANCSAFLNALVQIRVSCEEFRGKKDEAELIDEYIEHLKEQYQNRMARSMSVDARPWRQETTAPQHRRLMKGVPKNPGSAPTTAMEKYKLRVYIGRRTGRMDLVCKEIWPAETDNADGAANGNKQSPAGGKKKAAGPAGTAENTATATGGGSNGEEDEGELMQSFDLDNPGAENGTADGGGGGDEAKSPTNGEEENGQEQEAEDEEDPEAIFQQVDDTGGLTARSRIGDEDNSGPESADLAAAPPEKAAAPDFRLSVIPKEVLRMTELTELWLCNNVISVIPTEIADLKQLTLLAITNNKITTVPPEICLLENMKRLYLRKNELKSLPNIMGKMRSLIEVDCSENQFSQFPEVLTALPQLQHINFTRNSISSLPMTLRQITSLVFLNLEDNNFPKDGDTPPVLEKMPWTVVLGCPVALMGAKEYMLRPDEETELRNMLKSRAAGSAAIRSRRGKLRQGNLM